MTKNHESVEVDQADSENVLAKVDTNKIMVVKK